MIKEFAETVEDLCFYFRLFGSSLLELEITSHYGYNSPLLGAISKLQKLRRHCSVASADDNYMITSDNDEINQKIVQPFALLMQNPPMMVASKNLHPTSLR